MIERIIQSWCLNWEVDLGHWKPNEHSECGGQISANSQDKLSKSWLLKLGEYMLKHTIEEAVKYAIQYQETTRTRRTS